MEVGIVTEVFLDCVSAVIGVTVKVANLLFLVRGSNGLWAFTWFLTSAQGTNSATGLRGLQYEHGP